MVAGLGWPRRGRGGWAGGDGALAMCGNEVGIDLGAFEVEQEIVDERLFVPDDCSQYCANTWAIGSDKLTVHW